MFNILTSPAAALGPLGPGLRHTEVLPLAARQAPGQGMSPVHRKIAGIYGCLWLFKPQNLANHGFSYVLISLTHHKLITTIGFKS